MTQQQSNKSAPEHVADQTPDLKDELAHQLRSLMPESFSEGEIDLDKLRSLLGKGIEPGAERYSFSWAGKRDAIAMLQAPTRATLVPDRAQGIDFNDAMHVFIEGENLEVLKTLYRSYFGRVKLIYLDPPYNTGKDFIYSDNFTDPLDQYLRLTGQKSSNGDYLTTQPEHAGRFHSSWLSMMYPRLAYARQFLRDDGVILVSIDSVELHHLMILMNDVFGEENAIGTIVWKGATDNNPTQIAMEHEYIVCFAKNKPSVKKEWSNRADAVKEVMLARYESLKKEYGGIVEKIQTEFRRFVTANKEQLVPLTHYTRVDEDGVYTGSRKVHNPHPGGYKYDVIHPKTKKPCVLPVNGYRYPEETMKELLTRGKIIFGDDEMQIIQIKEYLQDYEAKLSSVITLDSRSGSNELKALFDSEKIFDNPKPTILLREVFGFILDKEDLFLDFFSGSGSSAHAVIDMNRQDGGSRRTISVQFPEPVDAEHVAYAKGLKTIAEIGAERIRRVLRSTVSTDEGLVFTNPKQQGLRLFRLADSHTRRWSGVESKTSEAYVAQLEAFTDSLAPGWKPEAVIWEVALREGFSLMAQIQSLDAPKGQSLWRVTDTEQGRSFTICLDDKLTTDSAKTLKLSKDDLFICRDTALDDSLAANLALQCRLKVI